MQNNVHHYFACANSSNGFVDQFSSVLQGLARIFILKGGPGTGKSTLMRRVGKTFEEKGESVEYIHCSSDADSLDGVILRGRKVAVVDGTHPHVIEPTAPGACEEYVNLGVCWDREQLVPYRDEILRLKGQISREYKEIYRILAEAKEVHDRWEKVYFDNLDVRKLDESADALIFAILEGFVPVLKRGELVHRFFGALTPQGSVNYIDNLTQGLDRRYLIQGRPGTGKSTLMKKIATAASECGIAVEMYHCSLDPNSVDMVILRELGVCVVDATAPHEVYPEQERDVIVDLYLAAVTPGTDEENLEILSLVTEEYARRIKEAQSRLARVHHLHDALEEYYINAMDFKQIEQIIEDIIFEIE